MVQFFYSDMVDDIVYCFGKSNFKLLKGIFKKKVLVFVEGVQEDFLEFSLIFVSLGQVVLLFFKKGIFKKF